MIKKEEGIVEESYIVFNGENWKQVLYFLKGQGVYSQEYEYKTSGEIKGFISVNPYDIRINVTDVVSQIGADLVVFTEDEWANYNKPVKPDLIIEFERLLNILAPVINEDVDLVILIDKIFNNDIEITYLENGEYIIDGMKCKIIPNDGKFQVDMI